MVNAPLVLAHLETRGGINLSVSVDPSGSTPGEIYMNQRFSLIRSRTSVRRPLIWYPNFHRLWSIMTMLRFWTFSSKRSQKPSPKEVPNVLPVSLIFINGDPFSDAPKSKAQTTEVQEHWSTLHIPFAKINYFPDGRTDERTNERTFLVLHSRT